MPPPGRPEYAWLLRFSVRRWLLRRLLRRAVPFLRPASRLVDLGAGTAADLEALRSMRPDLVGAPALLVEAQRGMLDRVPDQVRRVRGTERALADAARLPLRDGSTDLVLSIGLLCCVAESAVPSAIAETSRILAPGGLLVLAVPRWRGARDERATAATGLLRLVGGRPGHAVFRKPGPVVANAKPL